MLRMHVQFARYMDISGSDADPSPDDAKQLLTDLFSFDASSTFGKVLKESFGAEELQRILSVHDGLKTSTTGKKVLECIKKNFEPVQKELEDFIKNMFDGTTDPMKVLEDQGKLSAMAEHKFTSMTPSVFASAQYLFGSNFVKQLVFSSRFAAMASSICKTKVALLDGKDSLLMKIGVDNCKLISETRTAMVDFKREFQKYFNSDLQMFPEPDSERTRDDAVISVSWNLSGCSRWCDLGKEMVDKVCDRWIADLDGVCRLTANYDVPGWPLCREKILEDEQTDVRERLVNNPNLLKLPKGAALISSWRRCLKSINSDGAWAKIPADLLQKAQTTSQSASLTAEFAHMLKQVLEISNMNIKVRRIKAAEAFKSKVKAQSTILGVGLETRLAKLAAGESFKKKDEDEDNDENENNNEDEPPVKRQKLSGKQPVQDNTGGPAQPMQDFM